MHGLVHAMLVSVLGAHLMGLSWRPAVVSAVWGFVLVHFFENARSHIREAKEDLIDALANVRTFLGGVDGRLLCEFSVKLRNVFIVGQTWLEWGLHLLGQHIVPVESVEERMPSNGSRVICAASQSSLR